MKPAYSSVPLPCRKALLPQCNPPEKGGVSPPAPHFAEIPLAPADAPALPAAFAAPVPAGAVVSPRTAALRTLFSRMREMARGDASFFGNPARAFVRQARFMAGFTDDFAETAPFSVYFPSYQLMGFAQLRTYFSWRARVRRGEIDAVPLSYAFLYVYELINQIGVASPRDGLDKLVAFWQAFRRFDDAIDPYMRRWLKDYHTFYGLEAAFADFARTHGLVPFFPAVFAESTDPAELFALFSALSPYQPEASKFYTARTGALWARCFARVVQNLRDVCQKGGVAFEDFFFYAGLRETPWTPFARALFYSDAAQEDRTVALSPREVYACQASRWTCRATLPTEQGRRLAGFLLKATEAELRRLSRFPHKLRTEASRLDTETRDRLAACGIDLPRLIRVGTAEGYREAARKEVTVRADSLAKIRREALETQARLTVPEEAAFPPAPAGEKRAPEAPRAAAAPNPPPTDPWAAFFAALPETGQAALLLLFSGGNVKALATARGILLEVLVDAVNQTAADILGDTLLEIDGDTVAIHEEYREKTKEWVK